VPSSRGRDGPPPSCRALSLSPGCERLARRASDAWVGRHGGVERAREPDRPVSREAALNVRSQSTPAEMLGTLSDLVDRGRMRDDFHHARWYVVRPAANRKPSNYPCPLCGGLLPALSTHMLVVPKNQPPRRRHAHTECVVQARKAEVTALRGGGANPARTAGATAASSLAARRRPSHTPYRPSITG
jgi:hypothetical protein